MELLIYKGTLPYPNGTIWKCSYNFSKPLQKYSPVCYCVSDLEDRTEDVYPPSAAPFLSCPAGLLIRGSAQRKDERRLLHEKDIRTDRFALSAYARTRSGARATRAPGGSHSPAGIRAEPAGGQYCQEIILPGHAGRSRAAYSEGDCSGPVVWRWQDADQFLVDGAISSRPVFTSRSGHK